MRKGGTKRRSNKMKGDRKRIVKDGRKERKGQSKRKVRRVERKEDEMRKEIR
jgi:hypothetical protein